MERLKWGKKVMIIIFCVIVFIIGIFAGRILFLSSATTGKLIEYYSNGKAALVVIDIQEDTVNIPQYKNMNELIQNINASINYAAENGIDIIYIKEEYSNILDLTISGGLYKKNSSGAGLSSQLQIKSGNIFNKLKADAFSEKEIEQYLIDNQIDTLYIVGADASACVYKTSLGGVNRGYNVVVLKDCLFSLNEITLNKMLIKYEKAGIKINEMKDFFTVIN